MDKNLISPVVSVIMPAYNAADFIQEAIDSVIAQTFRDWELIIINDGSTDSTAAIISGNMEKDSRIKSLFQENGKQGKARNLGISLARGTYVGFLDADDLWLPEKLSIQLQEISAAEADLVFSDSYVFHDKNSRDRTERMHTFTGTLAGDQAIDLFLDFNRIPNLTVLVKKERLAQVNGFSENTSIANAEDYHVWLKILLAGGLFYGSEKTLAAYRLHGKASTNNDKLASKKIPAVLFDLMQQYPAASLKLKKALKGKYRLMYTKGIYGKVDLDEAIEENCRYLHKNSLTHTLKRLHAYTGTRVTKLVLILFLNA
jgi:glycosyltransferase involved in cell wall biosynthesis